MSPSIHLSIPHCQESINTLPISRVSDKMSYKFTYACHNPLIYIVLWKIRIDQNWLAFQNSELTQEYKTCFHVLSKSNINLCESKLKYRVGAQTMIVTTCQTLLVRVRNIHTIQSFFFINTYHSIL